MLIYSLFLKSQRQLKSFLILLAYLRYDSIKSLGQLYIYTTVMGRARLTVLLGLFKDVLLSEEAEKDNRETPEIMQAL